MPDSPAEVLLAKFGLDLAPLKQAGTEIKSILDALNKVADQSLGQSTQAMAASKARLQEVQGAAQAAIAAAKVAITEEQRKTAETRTAATAARAASTEALTAERQRLAAARTAAIEQKTQAAERVAALKAESAELRNQILEIRKKAAEERAGGGGGAGGHGTPGGLRYALGRAIFGQGIGGAVAAGVLAGSGITVLLESASRAAEHFIEKIKEAVVESGNLVKVWDQFQKLASGSNVNAIQYIAKLREATEGEISDLQLLQAASAALKRGIKPEDFVEAAEAVTKLAESSGHTAAEGLSALNQTMLTGRTRALAMVTGLASLKEGVDGLPASLGQGERATIQLTAAIQKLKKGASDLGDTPDTIEDMAKRMEVASHNLYSAFGLGVNQGAEKFVRAMSEMAKQTSELILKAAEFGRTFGHYLNALYAPVVLLTDAMKAVWKIFEALVIAITGGSAKADEALLFLSHVIIGLATELRLLAIVFAAVVTAAYALGNMDFAGARQAFRDMRQELTAVMDDAQRAHESLDTMFRRGATLGGNAYKPSGGIAPPSGEAMTGQQIRELAALRVKSEQEMAKLLLQQRLNFLDRQKQLDEQEYQDGERSLEEHGERQKEIAFEIFTARVQEAGQQRDARLSQARETLERELDIEGLSAGAAKFLRAKFAIEEKTARDVFHQQSLQAEKTFQDTIYNQERQTIQARLQLAVRFLDGQKRLQEQRATDELAGIKRRQQLEEEARRSQQTLEAKRFGRGETTPDVFIAGELRRVQERTDAEKQAAEEEYAIKARTLDLELVGLDKKLAIEGTTHNQVMAYENERAMAIQKQAQAAEDLEDKKTAAAQRGAEQRAEIEDNVAALHLRYVEKRFQVPQQGLETRLQIEQMLPPGFADTGKQISLIRDIVGSLESYKDHLAATLPLAKKGSDEWEQIRTNILRATLQQVRFNNELRQLKDILPAIANVFGELGRGIGTIFTSRFAQNLSSEIGIASGALGQSRARREAIFGTDEARAQGKKAPITDTSNMGEFSKALVSAVGALTDFVSAITHAQSAAAGVLGGGMTGASVGSMFGPIGTAVGAGVGALMGGIVGHKNAEVTKHLHEFETQYRDLMNQFAQNTNNLQNTIVEITRLVAQIQQMQASSKKGGSQYQDLINQYNQQLMQLQNQQIQVLRNLQEQLSILRAPTQMQDLLGTIQQIVKQYQLFEGAARNARDLADANDYLVRSLENYELNLENQLAQDNEQAINDELQLQDLMIQRRDLVQSINQQMQSILSRGVVTRAPTRAMAAGQEIAQLQRDSQLQMDRINFEISATTQRVEAEHQVFSLATTRIGLETQLLELKARQTGQDMAHIQALQNLIHDLRTGTISGTSIDAIIGATAGVTNPNIGPLDLANLLERLLASAYQDRSSAGYAAFRGQNL